jgi:hypothetical protein
VAAVLAADDEYWAASGVAASGEGDATGEGIGPPLAESIPVAGSDVVDVSVAPSVVGAGLGEPSVASGAGLSLGAGLEAPDGSEGLGLEGLLGLGLAELAGTGLGLGTAGLGLGNGLGLGLAGLGLGVALTHTAVGVLLPASAGTTMSSMD